MSYAPTSFDAPPPKPGELAPPRVEVQYLNAYNFVFENPNWVTNLLYLGLVSLVSGFIPIVGPFLGQLVTMGYLFEMSESLNRTGGRRYADFNFDRLGEYLMRGLWPFIAAVVGSLPILPVLACVALAIFGIWGGFAAGNANGAFGNADPSPALIAVSVGIGVLALLVIWLYSLLVVYPMTLRAGLSQSIGEAFKFAWIGDYVAKVWFEAILVSLFIGASTLVMVVLGFLMACVGHYFTIALAAIAQAHLTYYQLYQLYLSRGGEPIPLKMPAFVPPVTVPGVSPFAAPPPK